MASTSGTTSGDGLPPKKTAEIKKLIHDKIASGEAVDSDFMRKFFDEVITLMEGVDNKSQASSDDDSTSDEDDNNKIPDEFICPISNKMMSDPVITASGQTFDRPAIVNWRKSGKRTCPVTKKFLSHEALTPNHLLRKSLSKWCKSHSIAEPAQPLVVEEPTKAHHQQLTHLHMNLSTMGPSKQRAAAKSLCRLTKGKAVFRTLYAEGDEHLRQLLHVFPLSGGDPQIDPYIHEAILTVLLNILTDEKNKKVVAEFHLTIPVLIKSLEGTEVITGCKAAEVISEMSSLDSNKELIGNSDVLKLLINLLKVRIDKATRDAIKAISILCENDKNVKQAVELGAVFVVAEKFLDKKFMDELLAVLARFSVHKQACAELEVLGFAGVLLSIMKNDRSDARKETAILILHNVLVNNRENWKNIVRGAEENLAAIVDLSKNGTPIAKIKAKAVLERLNKDTVTSMSSSSTPP